MRPSYYDPFAESRTPRSESPNGDRNNIHDAYPANSTTLPNFNPGLADYIRSHPTYDDYLEEFDNGDNEGEISARWPEDQYFDNGDVNDYEDLSVSRSVHGSLDLNNDKRDDEIGAPEPKSPYSGNGEGGDYNPPFPPSYYDPFSGSVESVDGGQSGSEDYFDNGEDDLESEPDVFFHGLDNSPNRWRKGGTPTWAAESELKQAYEAGIEEGLTKGLKMSKLEAQAHLADDRIQLVRDRGRHELAKERCHRAILAEAKQELAKVREEKMHRESGIRTFFSLVVGILVSRLLFCFIASLSDVLESDLLLDVVDNGFATALSISVGAWAFWGCGRVMKVNHSSEREDSESFRYEKTLESLIERSHNLGAKEDEQ